MNFTIVSQNFYPEEFRINDLAFDLAKMGHKVVVLTGKPNYPQGEFFQGYKFWGIDREEFNGVTVIRVPEVKRKKAKAIRLAMNYLSFVIFGSWYALTHRIKSDGVFCFGTSPIIQMFPALVIKSKAKCKAGLWVQDLWPESVIGHVKNRTIPKLLNGVVKYIYRKTDILFIQSKQFAESILEKGDFQSKLVYAPNWAEDIYVDNKGDKKKYQKLIPEGFIVMFAGNLGAGQDLDTIIRAFYELREKKQIKLVILGDGSRKIEAEEKVRELGLTDTVFFLGRYPSQEMPNFFTHADCLLVSLKGKEKKHHNYTIPSKTQSYMAYGKPILSVADGAANEVIMEANCGLTAKSGAYVALAKNILAMSEMDSSDLRKMGRNGEDFYDKNFKKEKVIDTILSEYEKK